jgi:hypothetical protein
LGGLLSIADWSWSRTPGMVGSPAVEGSGWNVT